MRVVIVFFLVGFPFIGMAKEWKSLKAYQKETQLTDLQPQDWLRSDRTRNTAIWMSANLYNLTNNRPQDYVTIKQRKDFFKWLNIELKAKGHEVVWPSMAYYISNKLRLLECFPYEMLTKRQMKAYAKAGSEAVFVNAFETLNDLFHSEEVLKRKAAVDWDKAILQEEQFVWIEAIYQTIDEKSLQQIERIAKGKSVYGLFVPKAIRFEGDISIAEDRYNYALNKLRSYCMSLIK